MNKDRYMNKSGFYIFLIVLSIIFLPAFLLASSKITGKVVDKSNGDPLPGASVYLVNTSIGVASDLKGNYTINNVPPGSYTLRASYLGYTPKNIVIKISSGDITLQQNFELEPLAIEGKEVVVTAQAVGQMQAINQQIS